MMQDDEWEVSAQLSYAE